MKFLSKDALIVITLWFSYSVIFYLAVLYRDPVSYWLMRMIPE